MKKLFAFALITIPLLAVGPKWPSILSFTPSPTPGVTGYWLYWRQTNGAYADTARWPIPSIAGPGYDLRVIGLSKGQYYVAMTATNATSESDLSAEVLWDFTNPNPPVIIKVQ